jgi:hypothetical protein
MSTGRVERTFASSPQKWFLISLLCFFVGLSVQYSCKVLDFRSANRSAILRWREQIIDLTKGEDIYLRYNYPNPPIMALMLYPLTELSPLGQSLAWFYLKVGMALWSLWLVFRLVEDPERPFPAWGKALTVLLSLRPIIGDLTHGNVNLLILWLVVLSLYACCRGRGFVSGLALALAIACKVTPALFVPYFVWKRAWKVLLGCGTGLVLFLWVVPGFFLGMEHNARLLDSWIERMILPYVVGGEVTTEHQNQSLPGVIHRLTTHSPSFLDVNCEPAGYDNLLNLDRSAARGIVKGCMLLFAGLIVWSCRTPTTRRGWPLAAEFSLILLGMLLFSERTWKHHCVTLMLPFAVISYYLALCRPGGRLRTYLIGSLVVALLLMASTGTGIIEKLDGVGKLAQVYGAYVWAYLVLGAALVVLLRCGEVTEFGPNPAQLGSCESLSPVHGGFRAAVEARR